VVPLTASLTVPVTVLVIFWLKVFCPKTQKTVESSKISMGFIGIRKGFRDWESGKLTALKGLSG
jgi:hypothetical protein